MTQHSKIPSLNRSTRTLVDSLVQNSASLRLRPERLDNGVMMIDAGIDCLGGLEAGRRIAEICMGGQGHVALQSTAAVPGWSANIAVHSNQPVLACLGSQYAGWSLSHGKGESAFHALGSGPGRILARKEKLYEHLEIDDIADCATLVLEVDQRPPIELTNRIASECGVQPEQLSLILTPTRSLAGTTQIVARVLEVALHKAHELGFELSHIVDGVATAPLPPPTPDFLQAMGRTNDAILFAGQIHLFVTGMDSATEALSGALPSSTSGDYGQPFADMFKACGYDFFKIDPLLFSPARVTVSNLESGNSFSHGFIDHELLRTSFGVSK
ncbi:MAG: methenyltetrahydromethanopterin cyclohydrolase [Sedimenticola sp.]|nr:methenyltetrahydromethanopterin cyclohydrolase [Sedimenticola sp.]